MRISSWFIALLKATKSRHFTYIQSQSPQVTGICTEFILDVSLSWGCPESCCMLQSSTLVLSSLAQNSSAEGLSLALSPFFLRATEPWQGNSVSASPALALPPGE